MVNWGDGNTSTIDASRRTRIRTASSPFIVEPTATSPGTITLGHVYNGGDPYTVTITITDKDGLSSTVSALYVAVIPTTTTVTSSTPGDVSVYGQPVTFTAEVTGQPGFATPTGTVTFDVNGVPAAQETLSGGIAQFIPSTPLAVGSDTITAFYGGAGAYTPSDNTAAPLIQTVNQDTTTTTVASSTPSGSSVYGQLVTFTATVTVNSPGAGRRREASRSTTTARDRYRHAERGPRQ